LPGLDPAIHRNEARLTGNAGNDTFVFHAGG
jgi:Ca2+-binding RTX toxin-like protein